MNAPRCTPDNYIDFLIASPGPVSCTEAARVQPASPFAPAHDSFTRLLNRLEPDPETLWQEAEPLVETNKGVLVLDDSTNDKPYAKHIGLVTRHWSGKHKKPVRGINLITLLWTDGDRKIPCDYRLYSKADGKTKNDHTYLGGTLRHRWIWSGIACPSNISTPRRRHRSRRMVPICRLSLP